jgi:hypothetical protein
VAYKEPDPRKAFYVFISGMKGRGKSYYARSWWDSYPYDRLVVDVTHDVREDFRAEGLPFTDLSGEILPVRLPEPPDDEHPFVTCVYCPDMGSPTVLDEIGGTVDKGGKAPPNQRRILRHGRHHNLFLLGTDPRPMEIPVLWPAQADLVVTYRTPLRYDSDRIADQIGYNRDEYLRLNASHCKGHAYTLYDRNDEQLYLCPPLPPRRAGVNAYAPYPEGPQ